MIRFFFSLSVRDKTDLAEVIAKKLGAKTIRSYTILKKSIDARKKDDIKYIYQVAARLDNEKKYLSRDVTFYEEEDFSVEKLVPKGSTFSSRPVVVGSGPAGLFCAYVLALAGTKPLVLERGESVDEREKTISDFFRTLVLDADTNVQFGEGGAGTFSDGKLNTNVHNGFVPYVLKTFVSFGAPEEILYLAKPHIGTDNLRVVVKNMREKIIALGGEFFFGTRFVDFDAPLKKLVSVTTTKGKIECENLFLAIGHSARDTFEMLYRKNVNMVSKPYSMGVRIEHLRTEINKTQYGKSAADLPAADYKTAVETDTGRSLYTFCMCPGGRVINASSEVGGVCVNGMSYFRRDDVNSNSAILVNVGQEDWQSEHPLAGMEYQRKYERLAFSQSSACKPVVQTYGDFVKGRVTDRFSDVQPSVESPYFLGDLKECLPDVVVRTILQGVPLTDRRLRGFAAPGSVLTGIEARSSSPVRILRDDKYRSNIDGIFPIGEGAGYAGGITSAAIDGMKAALCFLGAL